LGLEVHATLATARPEILGVIPRNLAVLSNGVVGRDGDDVADIWSVYHDGFLSHP
jgi:hypothetical protein